MEVVAEPSSVGDWVQLLLLSRCSLQVVKPQTRRDCRTGIKSLQQHHILCYLARWRETDGVAKLVDSMLDNYGHEGQDGHFTAAVKVLGSSGVSPCNGGTLKALGDKHPYMPPPYVPTIMYSDVPLVMSNEFIASTPLTPLLKPDGGIRPIVVGTIWRRFVSKVAMKGVCKDVAKYLNDFQFGVRISGGAEAILHSANRLLSHRH
ncbi:hypothetical protein L195_g008128 [Trifolium pratense]|uniref:Uncharacterized protein n=1 Tax=Trifolium pratense TaxID=57577 RepID=A0A2K3P8C4_TRIPR|nr:hypothetical protein L195_g008128 [Trifolium pratense]